MKKQVKVLSNGNLEITTIKEVPRYIPCIFKETKDYHDSVIKEIMEDCYIVTTHPDYEILNNYSFKIDRPFIDALKGFQDMLDKTVLVCEAFILSVNRKDNTFSISKTGVNIESTDIIDIGLIGLSIEEVSNIDNIAQDLTDAWNGNFYNFSVYDNLKEKIVDSISHNNRNHPLVKSMERNYNVNFDNLVNE